MAARRTIDDLLESARSGLARLSPPAAYAAVRDGALLIDTRCDDLRRQTGAIPASIHVPLSVLFWRLDTTSAFADPRLTRRDRRIVLVCAHGYSSSLAAATLRKLGVDATDVIGGFEAWAEAGLPIERLPIEDVAREGRPTNRRPPQRRPPPRIPPERMALEPNGRAVSAGDC